LYADAAHRPPNDPVAGFRIAPLYEPNSHKAIEDDCKDYIRKLSPEERDQAGRQYFEDGTGQHAIMLTIGLNGKNW
jgi:hypothetical protein